jgi:hypothetical protein
LLGDVHYPLGIRPNIHYIGALLPLHFGDAGSPRGWVILDDKTGIIQRRENLESPRFFILRDGLWNQDIRPRDFVRIDDENPDDAAQLHAKARALGCWVECTTPARNADVSPPRTDIRTGHSDDEMVAKYLKYIGASDPNLVARGHAYLTAARAALI